MNELYDKLIDLYSDSVDGSDSIVIDSKELQKIFGIRNEIDLQEDYPGYSVASNIVGTMAVQLNKFKNETPNISLKECLKLVKRFSLQRMESDYSKKMEVLKKLVEQVFYPIWNDQQQSHFDQMFPKLCKYNLIFFSYTNREVRDLNNYYDPLIQMGHSINNKIEFDVQMLDNNNYVADLFMQKLAKNFGEFFTSSNNVFFDKHRITSEGNDRIKEEITTNVNNSFFFLQFVTDTSLLTPSPQRPNWQFFEYKEFTTSLSQWKEFDNDGKVFTVSVNALKERPNGNRYIIPKNVNPDYDKWKAEIESEYYQLSAQSNEKFEKSIEKVGNEISKRMDKLLFGPN